MKLEASHTRPVALHIRPIASHTRPKRRPPARSWQDVQDIQFCAAQPALRRGPALPVGLRPLGTKRKGGSIVHTQRFEHLADPAVCGFRVESGHRNGVTLLCRRNVVTEEV